MSINFDFIATSRPINSTASKCLKNGEHFDFKRTEMAYCSKDPLETKKFTGDKSFDLTGFLFGEFKVMGYLSFYKQGRWLVRCRCGNYEIRKTGTIKKDSIRIKCLDCIRLESLKNKKTSIEGIIKKEHGGYKDNSHIYCKKIPLETVPYMGESWSDLTGIRYGSLKVIGSLGRIGSKKSMTWLVRCDCGNYCRRKSKTLKDKKGNSSLMCEECFPIKQEEK